MDEKDEKDELDEKDEKDEIIPLEDLNKEYPVLELKDYSAVKGRAGQCFPFEAPRPRQLDLIAEIATLFETHQVVGLNGETGVGKSPIAYTLARMMGNAYYITYEKFLQDQIMRDFGPGSAVAGRHPSFVVEELKGRGAYECLFDNLAPKPERYRDNWPRPLTCADGICVRQKADGTKRNFQECLRQRICPYYEQKNRAHLADMAVMNYHSFLWNVHLFRGDDSYVSPTFGRRRLMILDEGHNLESALLGFKSISISDRDLVDIGIVVPEFKTVAEYVAWVKRPEIYPRLEANVRSWEGDGPKRSPLTAHKEQRVIEQRNAMLALQQIPDPDNWVVQYIWKNKYGDDGHVDLVYHTAVVKPVMVGRYAQDMFFPYADRILIMSATLLSEDYQRLTLELPSERYPSFAYVDAPNNFPAANRPIYVYPSGSMNKGAPGDASPQADTLPKLIEDIEAIARHYEDNRGIIHTHTHLIAKEILDLAEDDVVARMLYQEDFGNDRGALVEEFKRRPNAIIVAPRMYEGLDCPDDVARWQVLCKMPYPDMGNPQQRKRIEQMALYFPHYTTTRIVQAWGRIVRHANDWGHTFILDEAYYRWQSSARKFRLFSNALREASAGRETHRRISSVWNAQNNYGRKS